jgi:hypothetical protein
MKTLFADGLMAAAFDLADDEPFEVIAQGDAGVLGRGGAPQVAPTDTTHWYSGSRVERRWDGRLT